MAVHENLPEMGSLGQSIRKKEEEGGVTLTFDCPDGEHEISFDFYNAYNRKGFRALIKSKAEYGSDDYEPNQLWWGCEVCHKVKLFDPIQSYSVNHELQIHMETSHPELCPQKRVSS